jgi:hypothetical protein
MSGQRITNPDEDQLQPMDPIDEDQTRSTGALSAVDPSNAEFQLDQMALDTICRVVSVEMLSTIATKDTSVEAWESITTMCIGDERIGKASTQKVRPEYEMLMTMRASRILPYGWLES